MRHRLILCLAVVLLGACSGGGRASSRAGQTEVTTSAPAVSTSMAPVDGTRGGLGATLDQMTAILGLRRTGPPSCVAAPSCFGPPVHNDVLGDSFEFTAVRITNGIVNGYGQSFPPGTSATSAEAEIMKWLPADAHTTPLTVLHNGGSCAYFNITSATLGRAFADPIIGDPQGQVGVMLSNTTADLSVVFDPANVQYALLDLPPVEPTNLC
jgi:hypothetical protein